MCGLILTIGLLENTTDSAAGKFIDIDWRTKSLDQEAAVLRETLVQSKMAKLFPKENVHRFVVPWAPGGIDVSLQAHAEVG